MRITEKQLRQIIREERSRILAEAAPAGIAATLKSTVDALETAITKGDNETALGALAGLERNIKDLKAALGGA